MRMAREASAWYLATEAASGNPATGAPNDAVAWLEVGAADGDSSGDAAGSLGFRMVGSWSVSVLVSGSGNTLQPSSWSAAPGAPSQGLAHIRSCPSLSNGTGKAPKHEQDKADIATSALKFLSSLRRLLFFVRGPQPDSTLSHLRAIAAKHHPSALWWRQSMWPREGIAEAQT